ncbi:hypothetical protein Tco_0343310 [Tanacetum coccineum]
MVNILKFLRNSSFWQKNSGRDQEGKVRRKLEKLLKGYEDVHFEAGFATGEGINAMAFITFRTVGSKSDQAFSRPHIKVCYSRLTSSNINTSCSIHSALYSWIVLGTVIYIDSKHYAVPQGLRAVGLVSGNPSGNLYNVNMYQELQVTLEFIMGDAGDPCVGHFTVVAQVGPLQWNFMMRSNGVGSRKKYSVNFQFNKTYITNNVVPFSFVSYKETRTSHHPVLCGPVIDGTAIYYSTSSPSKMLHNELMILCFVLAATFLFSA